MVTINNFKKVEKFLKFDPKKKTIIWVWVAIRAKDNAEHIERTVKSYHIQSLDDLEKRKKEIMKLCRTYHCRAYVCINPKPILNILFSLQSIVMENIKNELNGGTSMLLKGMLDSAVMKSGGDGDKLWILDVDTKDKTEVENIKNLVDTAQSGYKHNVVSTIPTAHGYHIITHPFDTRVLNDTGVEAKKEGLTLLYAYLDK